MKAGLFRKEALEHMAGPESLDELIEVTSPHAWIALMSIGLLLVVLVIWGFVGSVPTRISGQGMLLSGTLNEVVPLYSGQVEAIHVDVGDTVEVGQLLAVIAQPELSHQLSEARAQLRVFDAQLNHARQYGRQQRTLELRSSDEEKAMLEAQIRLNENRVEDLQGRLTMLDSLAAAGQASTAQRGETRAQLGDAMQGLYRARTELLRLDTRASSASVTFEEQVNIAKTRRDEAQRLVDELTDDLALRTQLTAPFAGTVVDVMIGPGELAQSGEAVLKLNVGSQHEAIHAVFFVPMRDGKKVQPGMPVHISPVTVRPEEFGYLVGEVAHVAAYPATTRSILYTLRNDRLVEQWASGDAPYKVEARLIKDSSTPSGFAWTSGRGPEVAVVDGTPVLSRIEIRTNRPIELAIPSLSNVLPE